jgi:hypothetical protein
MNHDDIERRAYELYESRGREDGRDLDDWLQAERETRNDEPDVRRGAARNNATPLPERQTDRAAESRR